MYISLSLYIYIYIYIHTYIIYVHIFLPGMPETWSSLCRSCAGGAACGPAWRWCPAGPPVCLSLSLSVSVYIYIYIEILMYISISISICIHTYVSTSIYAPPVEIAVNQVIHIAVILQTSCS